MSQLTIDKCHNFLFLLTLSLSERDPAMSKKNNFWNFRINDVWRGPLGCPTEAGDTGSSLSCGKNNGFIESCHFEANIQNLGRTGSCAGNYSNIAIEPLKYSQI